MSDTEESKIIDTDNEEKNEVIKKFNPKTEKGKFKVDCWNVEKNGDLTPRDVNKTSRSVLVYV